MTMTTPDSIALRQVARTDAQENPHIPSTSPDSTATRISAGPFYPRVQPPRRPDPSLATLCPASAGVLGALPPNLRGVLEASHCSALVMPTFWLRTQRS